MKKVFAIIVCLWTVFGICGCGANPQLETEAVSSSEAETVKGSKMESKILIAYFTQAATCFPLL